MPETTTTTAPAPSTTTTAVPPADTTTTTTPAPSTTTTTAPAAIWPDNWREQVAGTDEKLSAVAQRYNTPKEVFNALVAAQNKIRSGELRPTLSETPTADELRQYREAQGIPDDPAKYDLTFKDGLVVGEADKPIVDSFLKAAHGAHMRPDQVKAGVAWFYDYVAKQSEARETKDQAEAQTTADALRAEWGGEYRGNINRVMGFLDTAPTGLKDQLIGARLADGTGIFNNPDALRWLAGVARTLNPAGTVVPSGGGDISATVADEIKSIEDFMRTNRAAYNRDESKQARLRELYAAREQLQGQKK